LASLDARNWFRAEMAALWSTVDPADPLYAPYFETVNTFKSDAMPDQWTTLEFPAGSGAKLAASIGQPGCKRETGTANVVIACKAGLETDVPVLMIAAMIATFFMQRAQRIASAPARDIRTLVPAPPMTPSDANGRFFSAVVGVPFELDTYE